MGISPAAPAGPSPESLSAGLRLLHQARDCAAALGRDPWDFAVEIAGLHALGLTTTDLRWLVCQGWIEHAADVSRPGQPGRSFRPTGPLTFHKRTGFILAAAGLAQLANGHPPPAPAINGQSGGDPVTTNGHDSAPDRHLSAPPPQTLIPRWDRDRRELWLGNQLVKRFKVPAPNQELILEAFEEEGWPPRIDDPLPPKAGICPKRRLHDAIVRLNGRQHPRLLKFSGDGLGLGLHWIKEQDQCPNSAKSAIPVPR